MKNNIIVSGCSYSQNCGDIPYTNLLSKMSNSNSTQLAWPGQGNDTIIRTIKEQIKKGITDTTFICQLTHLHRFSIFCTSNQKWIEFQPNFINTAPIIKDGNIVHEISTDVRNSYGGIGTYGAQKKEDTNLSPYEQSELKIWYETYLKLIYDETHVFYELMNKVDELTKLVEDTNNKILYLFWPHTIVDKSCLEDRNFFNIDGEYSILKWSVENNLINPKDSHLNKKGHEKLTELLINKLKLTKSNLDVL